MQVIKNIRLKFGNIMLCFIISILCFSNVSALTAEETVGFNFTFNPSLSISLSSDELVIENLMPGNYASSNTISINVQTNNRNGYTLTAEVGDGETAALANNSLVNTIANTTFTSIANDANVALASFTPNYWGYTISKTVNNDTLYSGLLYGTTTTLNQTVDPSGKAVGNYYGGTVTNFTIGASAGPDQTSGEYTNIISFNIVPNVSTDITIESLKYLQDVAKLNRDQRTSVLNSMTEGQSYQLADSRDGEVYNVAKLADGNMWLQDNLRLGGDQTVALTSADTNITGSWTLPASISSGLTSHTEAQINTDFKNADVPLAMEQPGTGKVGSYYNYCAATAGTYCADYNAGVGDAQYDICPAGWRMPTGGPDGEYVNTETLYGGDAGFIDALKMPLSGNYYDDIRYNIDSLGYFWSSTFYSAEEMYNPVVSSTGSNASNNYYYRNQGFAMRCIMKDITIADMNSLQDFASLTAQQKSHVLDSMITGQTYELKDVRDGETYTVSKLADGNVWMTQNLRLGGASEVTLSPSDTNIASAWTLPASISENFGSLTSAQINADSKNADAIFAAGQSGTGKIGVYYNYCAASAGTYCMDENSGSGDAQYDICPKGWRLPTGGASGEYQNLYAAYDDNAANYVNALQIPLSGLYYGSSALHQGVSGGFWSSTFHSTAYMYRLNFNTSDAYPQYALARNNGASVRCVPQ